MVRSVGMQLIIEIQTLKAAQDPQTTGSSQKRRRSRKQSTSLHVPSVQIQHSFDALQDSNCFSSNSALTIALPAVFKSVQVLLDPETTSEHAIQAAHTLSTSLVEHLREITSNPESNHLSESDPTLSMQSIFALLATLYSSEKLSPHQLPILSEIIMDLVGECLSYINISYTNFINAAVFNESYPQDYRESILQGILTLCSITLSTSPIRQALLLCLFLEFQAVQCSVRQGRVAILARDDVLWYLSIMIEEVIMRTGFVKDVVKKKCEKLIWECMSIGEKESITTKASWITWKVYGLLCGIEVQ
jgi:hypothetical protein